MVYIGQDNGVTSTIGILSDDSDPIFVKTPTKQVKGERRLDHKRYRELLEPYAGNAVAVLERPFTHPNRYRASISAAKCHEAMRIILEQLDIPYEVIDSRNWQHPLFTGAYKKLTPKQASLELGNQLFPQFKQHKHADRDGLLIAYWLKNNHKSR